MCRGEVEGWEGEEGLEKGKERVEVGEEERVEGEGRREEGSLVAKAPPGGQGQPVCCYVSREKRIRERSIYGGDRG